MHNELFNNLKPLAANGEQMTPWRIRYSGQDSVPTLKVETRSRLGVAPMSSARASTLQLQDSRLHRPVRGSVVGVE